jgi:hypothetical protein
VSYSFLPEAARRAGLGSALIDEFERVIQLAIERPDSWKLIHAGGIRRIGLRRFPYAVFYHVLPERQLRIAAFAHHRKRPGYWLNRLKS